MKDFTEYRLQSTLDEAPLVMKDADMVDTLFKKIKDDIYANARKDRDEKNWPTIQALAKLAGFGVSKNNQTKGKSYRYDLKK